MRNVIDSEFCIVIIVINNGMVLENDDFSLFESMVIFVLNDIEKLVIFIIYDDDEVEENEYVILRLDGLFLNLYGDFWMIVIEIIDNDLEIGVVFFDIVVLIVNEVDGIFIINVYCEGSIVGFFVIDVWM